MYCEPFPSVVIPLHLSWTLSICPDPFTSVLIHFASVLIHFHLSCFLYVCPDTFPSILNPFHLSWSFYICPEPFTSVLSQSALTWYLPFWQCSFYFYFPGLFRCKGERFCISHSEVCDGKVDCHRYGDDEKYCFSNRTQGRKDSLPRKQVVSYLTDID